MRYRGIFVTGTGTGVGKTVLTRAIVRALSQRGLNVSALKPVESGALTEGNLIVPQDAKALIHASAQNVGISDICVYCFEDPVSPHLAAQRAKQKIEARLILDLLARWQALADAVVCEGAGGLMVPLSDGLIYADLIARTGFGLVVVAPNALGTINSVLLTVEAARRRNIDVIGVILNRTPPSELGNSQAIAHHGRVQILGEFPDSQTDNDDELAALAEQTIEIDRLLSEI
jgi:dethiobiotin synthetase